MIQLSDFGYALAAVLAVVVWAFFAVDHDAQAAGGYAWTLPVEHAVKAAGLDPDKTRCVSGSALGRHMGAYSPTTGRVQLHSKHVCLPITNYLLEDRFTNWTIHAFVTVGHEAAHARGIRSESQAECKGVKFAWRYMKDYGVFYEYDKWGIRSELLDDSRRPVAYKLRGTCAI